MPTYHPAVRYGGPIVAVHGLARALAEAGHDVHVFTTNVDGERTSHVPLDRPQLLDGVNVHYFSSPRLRRLYFSPALRAACLTHIPGFEVVHLHSVFLYPTSVAAHAARAAGVPYVLSPRGMLVRELIDRRSALAKRTWIALFERRNIARAAAIHLTSEQERIALEELRLSLTSTAVIANGVDEPPVHSDLRCVSADVRDACRRGFDILCLGRINWKKGLEMLIAALRHLPHTRVVIAGNDEEGFSRQLVALSARSGLGSRVDFLIRHVTGADKEALFSAARLVVMPSLSENFGNVALEAMARGKPVVVTSGVGAAEIVSRSGAGIVCRNGESDLALAIGEILLSPSKSGAMGARGAAYVSEHLSWDRIATEFQRLYSGVIENRQSAGADASGRAVATRWQLRPSVASKSIQPSKEFHT